jgi:hypothetical protein
LCYCNAFIENSSHKKQQILTTIPVQQGFFSDENKRFFLTKYRCSFWCYIYRRENLNMYTIFFPSELGVEDNYFLACSILCAQRIAHVNRPLYHYVHYSDSLSQSKNAKRYLDKLSVYRQMFDFAKKHKFYDKYKHELQFIYMKKAYLVSVINYVQIVKRPQAKILREIYQEFIEICPDYKKNPLYQKHFLFRIAIVFSHKMPRTASVVFRPILNLFVNKKFS